ncbi:54S ribosomal protein L10, mitochondrial [Golovinomyces cichoracearum]|uniref:54S ribosomal protein L10, mitochondrial n=1 Tax=Golovinomyces cichoracearum TaxID=62708 RepID=A0A420IWJ8_9PEZI|nr:54S ribosomal protein L10, mitochondrial [Golovinomyces cichoracearum]
MFKMFSRFSSTKLLSCVVSVTRNKQQSQWPSEVSSLPFLQNRSASILASLSDCPGAYNKKIRRGRGPSSGKGKTSGRGHKGQKAHGKVPAKMQGGQTSLSVVHGERGFDNVFSVNMSRVNLDRIQSWIDQGRIDPSKPITIKELVETRCIHGIKDGVKLLARNKEELKTPINILVSRASATAIEAVESLGGTIITRYYTRASIRRLLKGESESTSTPINLTLAAHVAPSKSGNSSLFHPSLRLLPDPSSRKDLEYYRDASKRGYLSHLVAKGHGPSLFFRTPGKVSKLKQKAEVNSDKKTDVTGDNQLW